MADLIIICTTRCRPANALRLRDKVAETSRAATSLLFLADDDDGTAALLARELGGTVGIAPRAPISERVNTAALHLAADPDIRAIGWLNDDMVPRTPGWDEILLSNLLGKPAMAWPESLRRPGFPEAIIISPAIITALGWMMEPTMRHYYCDEVWNDLAQATGCGAIDSRAVVEHLHPDRDLAVPRDATYNEAEAFGRLDRAAYRRWWRDRMPADIAKIKEILLNGPRRRGRSSTAGLALMSPYQ